MTIQPSRVAQALRRAATILDDHASLWPHLFARMEIAAKEAADAARDLNRGRTR